MAKINFGNTYDSARRDTHIVTSGRSGTEMDLGDQHDSSVRNDNVLDLADEVLLQQLSVALAAFAQQAANQPGADSRIVADVRQAAEAAGKGDTQRTMGHLRSAGEWALDTAKKIGSDLVVSTIRSAMGLD